MKVNGVENDKTCLFGPLTLKRGKTFLVFHAQPVWDLEEFKKLCPEPENMSVVFAKEGKRTDPDCELYAAAMEDYCRMRWGYIVLKTLEPSNIEIEGMSLEVPQSWVHVEKRIKEELGHFEWIALLSLVEEANALDEDKLTENTATFFLQLAAAEIAKQKKNKGSNSKETTEVPSSDTSELVPDSV